MSTRPRGPLAGRLLAAAVLLLLLGVALRHLRPALVLAALAGARPAWLALAAASYAAILPLWALQWWLLAPAIASGGRPSYRRLVGVVALTSSVLNTTPMLVGEAAAVVLLVARAGLERAAALSVLAMDQLVLGVAKVGLLVLASWLVTLPPWMDRGLRGLALLVLLLLVALLGAAWSARTVDAVARRLPARGDRALRAVASALAPLRSPQRGGGALALALAKKGAELAAIVCVQRAFGVELPPSSAVLVLASLNVATLLPVVPGNVGVYEAVVVLAYGAFGVPPERALGIALAQHACYFAALALPGYAWLLRVPPSRSAAAAR